MLITSHLMLTFPLCGRQGRQRLLLPSMGRLRDIGPQFITEILGLEHGWTGVERGWLSCYREAQNVMASVTEKLVCHLRNNPEESGSVIQTSPWPTCQMWLPPLCQLVKRAKYQEGGIVGFVHFISAHSMLVGAWSFGSSDKKVVRYSRQPRVQPKCGTVRKNY